MDKKILEKYIQFGIDNWFTIDKEELTKFPVSELIYPKEIYTENEYLLDSPRENIDWILVIWFNILIWDFAYKWFKSVCEIITSKSFIEAIARWIRNNETKWEQDEMNTYSDHILRTIDNITTQQASAIRDNKLEEFIL